MCEFHSPRRFAFAFVRLSVVVIAIAMCAGLLPYHAYARIWKDKSGRFSVDAELVETRDGKAVLKKADGSVISVPLERLSDDDRAFVASQAKENAPKLGNDYVKFPKAGLKLVQPKDFVEVDNFEGFYQEDTQASVVVVMIPDSYADAVAAFTPEQLQAGGMTLRSKENIKIANLQGTLVNVTQKAGEETYAKWVLIFGGSKETHIVTAMCPVAHEAKLSPTLKSVILTAQVAD